MTPSGRATRTVQSGAIMPYQKIIDRFGYFLKLRGLSLTKERRQVLETICDLNRIFTVDDLYFALHTSGKKISKATIYRTIQLFIEGSILRESGLTDRQASYELAEAGHSHGHMVCQHCNKITEFSGPTLERFIRESSVNNQFLTLSVQVKFTGICSECVKENPNSLRKDVCVPFLRYEQERDAS